MLSVHIYFTFQMKLLKRTSQFTEHMSANNTITTTTSRPKRPTTQEPAQQKILPNPKPTKHALKKVVPTEPPLEDDEDQENTSAQEQKNCDGDCVNGLVALFCDDIDSEAYCPADESCCITRTSDASKQPPPSGKPEKKTSPPPPPKNKIPLVTSPRPPPPSQTSSISGDLLSQIWNIAETTLTNNLSPGQAPSPPPPQKCPGFCLLNIMAAFCERPSVVIPYTTSCKKGNICCDNTRGGPPPRRPPQFPPTTQAPATPPPDPREECPGSCIVSLLSFTCFSE